MTNLKIMVRKEKLEMSFKSLEKWGNCLFNDCSQASYSDAEIGSDTDSIAVSQCEGLYSCVPM